MREIPLSIDDGRSVKLDPMEPKADGFAKRFTRESRVYPDAPRLDDWLARTTTPLDLLALCTIWLTVVPLANLDDLAGKPLYWWAGRIALSFIYFVDMAIRVRLSGQGIRYAFRHPVGVLAVVIPAVRILFSLRLLGAMFRKGNFVAGILLLNIAVIVYAFETRASGANITSIGIALWWACVTVATVGYGDYYPVTVGGRITSVALMVIGLTTIGVVTAQISSTFMDQAAARRAASSPSDPSLSTRLATSAAPTMPVDQGDVEVRLARIEQLLLEQAARASGENP
jgi:voltage-gated potassium channel